MRRPFEKMVFSISPNAQDLNAIAIAKPKHVLLSFSRWGNKHRQLSDSFINRVGYRPETIIIDSGAFTFHYGGRNVGLQQIIEEINAEASMTHEQVAQSILHRMYADQEEERPTLFFKYIDFLISNKGNYDTALTMDELDNPDNSFFSYQVLKAIGLNVMPVYHFGSNEDYLKQYAATSSYIALGASAFLSPTVRAGWVNSIIEQYPAIKFHLLGTNHDKLIKQCAGLYSADGTAYVWGGRNRARRGEDRVTATASEIAEREADAFRWKNNFHYQLSMFRA